LIIDLERLTGALLN